MAKVRIIAGVAGAVLFGTGALAGSAKEVVLAVPGIPGPYCAYGAEKRLLELKGVIQVKTFWESEEIRIVVDKTGRITADQIKEAMQRADYPYKYEIRLGK